MCAKAARYLPQGWLKISRYLIDDDHDHLKPRDQPFFPLVGYGAEPLRPNLSFNDDQRLSILTFSADRSFQKTKNKNNRRKFCTART